MCAFWRKQQHCSDVVASFPDSAEICEENSSGLNLKIILLQRKQHSPLGLILKDTMPKYLHHFSLILIALACCRPIDLVQSISQRSFETDSELLEGKKI